MMETSFQQYAAYEWVMQYLLTHTDSDLDPGDQLFVYTDGVPEANDKDGNFYGTDRMLAFEYCEKTADK